MPVITKTIRETRLPKLQMPPIVPRLLLRLSSKRQWSYLEILHPIDLTKFLEASSKPRKRTRKSKTSKRSKKRKR